MLEAVIFDMDGVIVDTEPGYYLAVNDYLAGFHVSISEEFNHKLIGISYSRIWELINEAFDLKEIGMEEFLTGMEAKRKERIAREGYTPVDGTLELVRELHNRGIPLAIASSSPKQEIQEVLEAVGIKEYFYTVVSGEDECEKGKPDPQIFLKAADRLKVEPKKCIVIEDSEMGIQAAKRAGMIAVGYAASFGSQNLEEADLVVTSVRDLQWKRLNSLFRK